MPLLLEWNTEITFNISRSKRCLILRTTKCTQRAPPHCHMSYLAHQVLQKRQWAKLWAKRAVRWTIRRSVSGRRNDEARGGRFPGYLLALVSQDRSYQVQAMRTTSGPWDLKPERKKSKSRTLRLSRNCKNLRLHWHGYWEGGWVH